MTKGREIIILVKSQPPFDVHRQYLDFSLIDFVAGGSGPITPTLIGPKILPFVVKVLYSQNFGRTNNNCVVGAFLKWSDQSRTSSATPGFTG